MVTETNAAPLGVRLAGLERETMLFVSATPRCRILDASTHALTGRVRVWIGHLGSRNNFDTVRACGFYDIRKRWTSSTLYGTMYHGSVYL